MRIISSVFKNNQSIPSKYTCDGDNINPPLEFQEVPEGTKSLLLIMEDPDVPKNIREDGMWNHWLIWNIPSDSKGIVENSIPNGVIGFNTNGKQGYGGPCPPDKEHRYFFKLYALDILLDIQNDSSKEELLSAMENHIIDQTKLIGLYNRIK